MSDTSASKKGLPEQVKMRHSTHFVEDLTVRSEGPVGRMVDIGNIEPDPTQPRSTLGDLSELAGSIEDKGILEPILIRPNPDASVSGKYYRIISGERRFQAALEAGLVQVPAIEMKVDEDEALEIALVENLQRKDLTPFEEGEGFRRLADAHGYTHEQIAGAVGKSRSVVTESLLLLEMSPEVREVALVLGVKTKSALLEILKLGQDPQEMIELLESVAARGLSRDDLRSAVRKARSGSVASGSRSSSRRQKPYTFKFKAPDKSFNLSLNFRRSTVDKSDLISALEEILQQLKSADAPT